MNRIYDIFRILFSKEMFYILVLNFDFFFCLNLNRVFFLKENNKVYKKWLLLFSIFNVSKFFDLSL